MMNHSRYRSEIRQKAIEKLKLNRVGVLIQIIEELEEIDLSVQEIEAVLRHCGLNYRNALQTGYEIIRVKDVPENEEG